jgi:hypothetical protein
MKITPEQNAKVYVAVCASNAISYCFYRLGDLCSISKDSPFMLSLEHLLEQFKGILQKHNNAKDHNDAIIAEAERLIVGAARPMLREVID